MDCTTLQIELRGTLWIAAQEANRRAGWGFTLPSLSHTSEFLQSVRYDAPHGWYAAHKDVSWEWNQTLYASKNENETTPEWRANMMTRQLAIIVQLSDRARGILQVLVSRSMMVNSETGH